MTALAADQVSLKDRKEAGARLVLQTIVESHALDVVSVVMTTLPSTSRTFPTQLGH